MHFQGGVALRGLARGLPKQFAVPVRWILKLLSQADPLVTIAASAAGSATPLPLRPVVPGSCSASSSNCRSFSVSLAAGFG
jgi:hypothetical protein